MAAHRPASGREQHTHKITVYLSADELFDLEHARLTLRRYGITTDRGRLVREAIAVVLADLDARGERLAFARKQKNACARLELLLDICIERRGNHHRQRLGPG